jgi:hypothetical protein
LHEVILDNCLLEDTDLRDAHLLNVSVRDGFTFWAVSFSPSSKLIAAGDFFGRVIVWDVDSGKELYVLKGHKRGWIISICWSSDGQYMASANDSEIIVWRTSDFHLINTIPLNKEQIAIGGILDEYSYIGLRMSFNISDFTLRSESILKFRNVLNKKLNRIYRDIPGIAKDLIERYFNEPIEFKLSSETNLYINYEIYMTIQKGVKNKELMGWEIIPDLLNKSLYLLDKGHIGFF